MSFSPFVRKCLHFGLATLFQPFLFFMPCVLWSGPSFYFPSAPILLLSPPSLALKNTALQNTALCKTSTTQHAATLRNKNDASDHKYAMLTVATCDDLLSGKLSLPYDARANIICRYALQACYTLRAVQFLIMTKYPLDTATESQAQLLERTQKRARRLCTDCTVAREAFKRPAFRALLNEATRR